MPINLQAMRDLLLTGLRETVYPAYNMSFITALVNAMRPRFEEVGTEVTLNRNFVTDEFEIRGVDRDGHHFATGTWLGTASIEQELSRVVDGCYVGLERDSVPQFPQLRPRGDDYWLVTGEDDGLEELAARKKSLAAKSSS